MWYVGNLPTADLNLKATQDVSDHHYSQRQTTKHKRQNPRAQTQIGSEVGALVLLALLRAHLTKNEPA
jgi:hypothetical protein